MNEKQLKNGHCSYSIAGGSFYNGVPVLGGGVARSYLAWAIPCLTLAEITPHLFTGHRADLKMLSAHIYNYSLPFYYVYLITDKLSTTTHNTAYTTHTLGNCTSYRYHPPEDIQGHLMHGLFDTNYINPYPSDICVIQSNLCPQTRLLSWTSCFRNTAFLELAFLKASSYHIEQRFFWK